MLSISTKNLPSKIFLAPTEDIFSHWGSFYASSRDRTTVCRSSTFMSEIQLFVALGRLLMAVRGFFARPLGAMDCVAHVATAAQASWKSTML